jgi:signal transduction histidine kinase
MPAILNDDTNTQPTSPVGLTRLYVVTLVGLALLLTVAEFITQWQIDKFQDEIGLIRYTAMQRHQSQQIVKKALLLTDARDSLTFIRTRAELASLFRILERNHLYTRQGFFLNEADPTSGQHVPNSEAVAQMYQGVWPNFTALQRSIRQLCQLSGPAQSHTPVAKASLSLLLENEVPFLEKIDAVVVQHTNELRHKLMQLQRLEFYLHILTLLTLAGIAWFMFRPATRRLQQTLSQLIEAEKRTADANRKLRSLNKSLKKARQQLFEASQRELQEQADQQNTRTAYLIAGQEEERKRLSRELHDGLGQLLTAIRLQVEGLESKINRGKADELNLSQLKTLIGQTIHETRSISNNLMPSVLSDFGLLAALRMLTSTHNRPDGTDQPSVRIEFEADDALANVPELLEKDVEITLYRVAQEAITNAIRHGKASLIRLRLRQQPGLLRFSITDNGVGFRPQRLAHEPHGQGVHNMQERIKLLNGTFALRSAPDEGTTIDISIPFQTHVIAHDYDQINAG